MGIDSKNIQIYAYRIHEMLSLFCLRFVQNHPYVAGVSSFVFFLYIHYPSMLKLLIYSSPILVCTIAYIKNSLNSLLPKTPALGDEKRAQCVRRNANAKNKDFQKVSINEISDEKPTSDFIPRNESDQWSRKDFGSGADLESLNLEDDDDEEEETQEDGNKAVLWTENDQKNLMDLGTSEIERNKRLESLIVKRRARKIMSMQVQRNLIDFEIGPSPSLVAPILIARTNNNFNIPSDLSEHELMAMPGSAPSVLDPMTNPFDLPYDPHEEKPNLTGDDFHQEYMIGQKDMCRHESFSVNPFFASQKRGLDGHVFSRFRRQSDENLVEPVASLECASSCDNDHDEQQGHHHDEKSDENVEIQTKNKEHDYDTDKSRNENLITKNYEHSESRNRDFPWALSHSLNNSISSMDLENINEKNDSYYDSSPSAIEDSTMGEQLFYEERIPGHTPSFSIASDMQVEVSETGSPPLTIGTVSPADGQSVAYEGDDDVAKDFTFVSEETWGATTSQLIGIEKNKLNSRAVSDEVPQDVVEEIEEPMSKDDALKISEKPYNPLENSSNNVNILQNTGDIENLQSFEGNVDEQGSKSLDNIEKNYEESQEHEDNNTESNKEIEEQNTEQNLTADDRISMERLNSDVSAITSTEQENGVEQNIINTSSSSSPKSVLPEPVFEDQDHLSNFDHMILVDAHNSAIENSLLLQASENLGRIMPSNEEQLMGNSMELSSDFHGGDDIVQEPSSPVERSIEEVNISNAANQSLVENKEGNDNLRCSDEEIEASHSQSIKEEEP